MQRKIYICYIQIIHTRACKSIEYTCGMYIWLFETNVFHFVLFDYIHTALLRFPIAFSYTHTHYNVSSKPPLMMDHPLIIQQNFRKYKRSLAHGLHCRLNLHVSSLAGCRAQSFVAQCIYLIAFEFVCIYVAAAVHKNEYSRI